MSVRRETKTRRERFGLLMAMGENPLEMVDEPQVQRAPPDLKRPMPLRRGARLLRYPEIAFSDSCRTFHPSHTLRGFIIQDIPAGILKEPLLEGVDGFIIQAEATMNGFEGFNHDC